LDARISPVYCKKAKYDCKHQLIKDAQFICQHAVEKLDMEKKKENYQQKAGPFDQFPQDP
jgi:hypothetical protein